MEGHFSQVMKVGDQVTSPQVNVYTLERLLTTTYLGQVFQAKNQNHELFAIKISSIEKIDRLQEKHKVNNWRTEDPRREATLLQQCHHPRIVNYIEDFCLPNESHVLVTEFVSGGDLLDHLLSLDQPPHLSLVRKWICQIWSALRYLHHQQGCAHLDLSLENILLDQNMDVKLIDFGVASVIQHGHRVMSKRDYMAPEIYRLYEDSSISWSAEKADMFSLGICLFMLLTKSPAFVEHESDIFRLLMRPDWTEYLTETGIKLLDDKEWITLLHRLLRPDHQARPSSRDNIFF